MNQINIERSWRNEQNWTYQIYSEKFSYHFGDFCETENIGRKNGEGLVLPKELTFLFMTQLEQEISYERNGSHSR